MFLILFCLYIDHTRQDSMEAWSKNGDSPMPPPLERRKYRNRSKAHSIVGTPNYIGNENKKDIKNLNLS
jgi:hypothetical protein